MAQRQLIPVLALLIGISLTPALVEAYPSRTSVLSDLVVEGPVSGDVVVFAADVVLGAGARVEGDVVAVGGNIEIIDGARVGRHVMAVFGTTEVAAEATVGGRVFSFDSLASLKLDPDAGSPSSRASVAVKLLASGGWLLVTTGLAFLFPIRMRYGAWAMTPLGYKVPALGMLVALTVVASLVAALGLGPALGIPVIAGLMVAFFAAKVVGLTVISCAFGTLVLKKWLHHPLPISLEVFVGMLALLVLRFLPVAGETLWSLVSILALGATVAVIGVGPGEAVTDPARS